MESAIDRTQWMSGHYGIMTTWLYPTILPEKGEMAKTLDEAVEHFNVQRLMQDFSTTGADWLIFTIAQNSGHYPSPNSMIERLAGPGYCSQRDLLLDIASSVHNLGKRFIAYIGCEIGHKDLDQAFGWNTQEGTDQAEFQRRYLTTIHEWSERLGPLMDGWWFDGCYQWPIFDNRLMDWPAWFSAARAGNPERVIAFNDGSLCNGLIQPVTPDQDYLSGETEVLIDGKIRFGRPETPMLKAFGPLARFTSGSIPTYLPNTRFVPGTHCQWHSLVPVDCLWGHGIGYVDWLPPDIYHFMDPNLKAGPMELPMYPDDELAGFLNNCLQVGGAVTLNTGIYLEGHLGEQTVQQLARIRPRVQHH